MIIRPPGISDKGWNMMLEEAMWQTVEEVWICRTCQSIFYDADECSQHVIDDHLDIDDYADVQGEVCCLIPGKRDKVCLDSIFR